ncbi:ubiquitin-conjugating enzyme E2 variant 3 isoform X3 [Phascolarctos cinereus]|uniref:Ubiquitin-conjugating enzyme E2 variant 3 isoform X3 n=1 Tax=Phascolarctos cinereus TaxID=38626 RepID=A0A6P5LY32_PHACI|nr:ubiquitin-conjugating enzyme E2 variant 3 isoform X3 [Phascolarctos cinereus]
MEFDSESLRRQLSKYKFRDLTVEELTKVNMSYPNFRFSMDTYVFKDNSQKDLLNFTGTIPVNCQGNTYNIPIRLWILDSHPFAPPICFLKPTPNMGISVGKHVDAQGRIYLPYLQNWSHPKSVITGLIREMIIKFQEELPLYSLSSADEAQQAELLAYISKITQGISDVNSKNQENKSVSKVTVVGGGELGIACVLAILAKGITDKVVLIDFSEGTKGGTMDMDIFELQNVEISKVPMWGSQEEAVAPSFQVQLSNRAMEILKVKGQRSWSVGLSVSDLLDSIINNKRKVHSVSVLAKGYYNINNEVFLSLPCILGDKGVSEVIKASSKEDLVAEKLQSSASSIHSLQNQLKL